jgi:hypothetical protein
MYKSLYIIIIIYYIINDHTNMWANEFFIVLFKGLF